MTYGAKVAEFTVNSRPDLPTFKTSSQVFKVIEHETVVLPCEVTHPGQYVLAWKRGIAVLSAGSVKVTPEPRLRLMNSYSLEITDAQPSDAGDYTCQIGTLEPREITHTLEILVPPQIDYMTADGKVEVKKGSSVRLECRASGNPEPVITWSRRNNLLPSGEKTRASPSLTLERVDRHQAGVYQCTATNGIGQPAINQINVHVLYPPEITVERPMVYSGEGLEAHLVCIVYGETQPEVHWYRDTMLLDTTERRIMETRGSRHTLVIRKVHPSDFGNYTCVADNQLGKARKVIELTGKPNPAIFRSSTLGQWRDRYNISWMVESHAPLEELKLYYRKLPDQLEQEQLQPLQHQSQQIPRRYPKKDSTLMYGLASTSYHGGPGEWHDVLITGNRDRQPPMSYMIRGLEPQSLYEAKIQTRNKYGWSPVSPSFTFQTTSTDNVIRDIEVFPSYNNVGSISSSTSLFGVNKALCD
ncbi:limbic system-associated membrane protein [Chrysoperla carnea]|uniref:limbic system-associated membrane protein n=1 Tax=Chrysoperla carnea TaxID=189513 RepID=UPI001D06F7FD|nr:limbic system-associated membrane protein [Chrysoperla carnea]